MKKNRLVAVLLALVLLGGFVNPVFAQDEADPPSDAEMEQEKLNPILQLIADFFRDLFTPDEPEEPVDPEPPQDEGTDVGDGTDPAPSGEEEILPTEEPVLTAEEIVASYHTEEDLGMGVMVKLFGLAETLAAECELTGENCDVDLETLVAQFESGVGIGELMDTYGKPDTLGVGHIKEPKSQSQVKVQNDNGTDNGNGKGMGNGKGN